MEGAKKRAAETTTRLETDLEEDSDVESNGDSGVEEDSQEASGSSGAEWSRAEDGLVIILDIRWAVNTAGRDNVAKQINLEGQSLVLL